MIVIDRQKYFLKFRETYFCASEDNISRLPVLKRFIQSKVLPKHICGIKIFKSYVCDLTIHQDQIFGNFSKNLRNQIRKSERDNYFIFEEFSDFDIKNSSQIIKSYAEFAKGKGIAPLNEHKLKCAARNNNVKFFTLTCNDNLMGFHIYLIDRERARLLYSYTSLTIKNQQSDKIYANEVLHWKCIKYFKEKKFRYYDFGGHSNNTPQIKLFKKKFGGTEEQMYNFWKIF